MDNSELLIPLRENIINSIGESNRALPRITKYVFRDSELGIKWTINSCPLFRFVRGDTKADIWMMLNIIADYGLFFLAVVLTGTYPIRKFPDKPKEIPVVIVYFLRETLNNLDWALHKPKDVYRLADEVILHPKFKE